MSQIDVVCYRPDVTAPTTPANLTATPSGTSILLACDVATDPAGAADEAITGVVGYRFYSALTQGGTYSALTTEATPGYTHVVGAVQTRWYKVGAVDYVGNVSTLSAAVGATTGGNQAPVWSAIGSQQLYIGSVYFLALSEYVSDPESQPITITMTAGSLPVGLSFNAAAKRVEGTPTTAQQASATFSASDGFDATAQAVSFTVSVAPVIEFVAESGFTVTSSTGVFEHGVEITITGTGFGTKTNAAPWIYDIGTGGYIGGTLVSYGALSDGQILPTTVWTKIQQAGVGRECSWWTSRPRRHERVAASYGTVASSPTDRNHKGVVGYPRWPTGWGTQNPQSLYVSWYQKVKNAYLSAQGGDQEDKIFRLSDTAGDGQGSNFIPFQGASFATVENPSGRRSFRNWPSSTSWQKFEVCIDTVNESADFYVNGQYQLQSASAVGGEFEFRPLAKFMRSTNTPTGDTRFAPLTAVTPINNLIPNMIGYDDSGVTNNSDGQEIDISEIYVDVSPKRVEVVDGTYTITSAQAREPCRLTQWSDTEIKCHINQGAFASLIGAQLYVVLGPNQERTLVGQFIEATPSLDNVTLSWTAPTTGDTSIAYYRVEWGKLANGAFGEFINSVRVDAPATSVSLQLPPRGYAFRVVTVATDGEESQPAFLGTKLVDDAHVSLRP